MHWLNKRRGKKKQSKQPDQISENWANTNGRQIKQETGKVAGLAITETMPVLMECFEKPSNWGLSAPNFDSLSFTRSLWTRAAKMTNSLHLSAGHPTAILTPSLNRPNCVWTLFVLYCQPTPTRALPFLVILANLLFFSSLTNCELVRATIDSINNTSIAQHIFAFRLLLLRG